MKNMKLPHRYICMSIIRDLCRGVSPLIHNTIPAPVTLSPHWLTLREGYHFYIFVNVTFIYNLGKTYKYIKQHNNLICLGVLSLWYMHIYLRLFKVYWLSQVHKNQKCVIPNQLLNRNLLNTTTRYFIWYIKLLLKY